MKPAVYPDPGFTPRYPWLGQLDEPGESGGKASEDDLGMSEGDMSPDDLPEKTSIDEDYQTSSASSFDEELESNASSIDEGEGRRCFNGGKARTAAGYNDWLFTGRRRRGRPRGKGRVTKGTKRGLVRPLEPDLEFKQALALANEAFIGRRLDEAQEHALEAIRLNPEIFQAHILLSEIYAEIGDQDLSLRALFNGAHTRSRDVLIWFSVKERLLSKVGDQGDSRSSDGILYCLTRILALQPDDADIRLERITLNQELGYYHRAAQDLQYLLQNRPSDLVLLRRYAEVSMKTGEIGSALQQYEKSIAMRQHDPTTAAGGIGWSDLNVYVELLAADKRYDTAIERLKSLSRWMLGRGSDGLWDPIDDDREWDLHDEPRRTTTIGFEPGIFDQGSYGEGLPLELRVKLGVYRLKLDSSNVEEPLLHFEWLDPENNEEDAKVHDYPDLYRDVADVLLSFSLYKEALRYYAPMDLAGEPLDGGVLESMALCYRHLGLRTEAENCYMRMIESGQNPQVARLQLISMGREDDSSQRIQELINSTTYCYTTGSEQPESTQGAPSTDADELAGGDGVLKPILRRDHLERAASRLKEVHQQEHDDEVQRKFIQLQSMTESARSSPSETRTSWLILADELIHDFASHKSFYPADKFYMSSVLSGRVHATQSTPRVVGKEVPELYRGIEYPSWLDIIMEASIFQARRGQYEKAYETVMVALDAVVFAVSPSSVLLIHVCWFTCAILAKDLETLCSISRWFMKEYQFMSDAYRLFGALNRVCAYENSWYNSGPSQKHVLRQLKAMDSSLRDGPKHGRGSENIAPCTTRGSDGNAVQAAELNVALLTLYGHILYAGRSYMEALNYYFRAYTVETHNAVLSFSIGIAYIHHAFKRQSDNRHHLILQGFSFLYAYYHARQETHSPSLVQEAEYNIGRAYHIIGLAHLAIPYYERCLIPESDADNHEKSRNFCKEAAVALQNIWGASGNTRKAKAITDRWLVI